MLGKIPKMSIIIINITIIIYDAIFVISHVPFEVFIYSSNRYLLRTNYVSGTGDTRKERQKVCSWGVGNGSD